jgi:hypothetical protein
MERDNRHTVVGRPQRGRVDVLDHTHQYAVGAVDRSGRPLQPQRVHAEPVPPPPQWGRLLLRPVIRTT